MQGSHEDLTHATIILLSLDSISRKYKWEISFILDMSKLIEWLDHAEKLGQDFGKVK